MELQEYIHVVRKRWRILLITTFTAALAAGFVTQLLPTEYRSTSQVFVSTNSSSSPSDLMAGSSFSQSQVKSYAELASTPTVLDPVIQRLGLEETSAELARRVSASARSQTVLIDIAVVDLDPNRSQSIADEVAGRLAAAVPELETVEGARTSPVKMTLVSPARAGEQVAPRPVRNIALGFFIGFVTGFGIAALRERLDTSINSERDVQDLTDATILGGIWFDELADAAPLVIQADTHSPRAEAFRGVRTNLQFVDVGHPPRTMAVTSSLPGEGKSTTSANLALAIAAAGASVCLVEGDLRNARLLEYLGLEGGVGLTDVLIGEVEPDDVLQPFADTNVTVLGAGPYPPNPSELLGSEAMRHLVEELRSRFDYVLIDTPPLLPVTDAAVLSRIVDGVIMVVGVGIVRREQLMRSLDTLDTVGARLLGLVNNRLPSTEAERHLYSHYGAAHKDDDRHGRRGRPGHRWLRRPADRRARKAARRQARDVTRIIAAPTSRKSEPRKSTDRPDQPVPANQPGQADQSGAAQATPRR